MKKALFGLLGVLGLAVSAPSNAVDVTFDSAGDSYAAQYSYTIDGASISLTITYTLSSISAGSATFSINVRNDSTGPGQNVLMSFGVDVITPPLSGVSDSSTVWDTALNQNLPSFQTIDFCAYASNGCTGGGIGNGQAPGAANYQTFNVTMTTNGDFTANGIVFSSPFPVKMQGVGVNGESYEFDICPPGTPGCRPPLLVPEPGSLALLGLGLLGVGLVRRRAAA